MPNTTRDVAPIGDDAISADHAALVAYRDKVRGQLLAIFRASFVRRPNEPWNALARIQQLSEEALGFEPAGGVEVIDLLARLRAAEARQQWRPISEAPRDGTDVWVYAPAYDGLAAIQCRCAWHQDAGWCVDELRQVSHYMPLPPPPEQP